VKDSPYTGGQGLYKPFDDAIKARGITTMLQTPLIALVAGPDREVLGVKVLSGGQPIIEARPMSVTGTGMVEVQATVGFSGGKEIYIKAKKGVVLTTGTWSKNEEMIKNFSPQEIPIDKRSNLIHHPEQQDGAGIIAGHAIGAALLDMGVSSDMGGLKINTKAQVIDVYGAPIPRLYAAPFAAAGSYPKTSPGSGHHHAHSVCFGRIAGQNAAAEGSWE